VLRGRGRLKILDLLDALFICHVAAPSSWFVCSARAKAESLFAG
jgi:hypothetical protein